MSTHTWFEITNAKNENRHELNLSGSLISQRIEENGMDDSIYTLSGLNYLCISQTCLEVVSPEIANLKGLTNLVLHTNNLSELPASIGELSNLKMLDVSGNKLKCVPEEITHLTQLSTLNLAANHLSSFPTLSKNVKLSVLDLSCNKFEDFPDMCHAELIHLADVKLNGNQIKEIPSAIKELVSLKFLDIGENALSAVPGELGDISKLKELNLKGNKLNDKRLLKLVDQCRSKQVLDYIRQHCARSSTTTESGGKGKKGKKGKKADHGEPNQPKENVIEQLSHKLHVLHVTDEIPNVIWEEPVKVVRPHIICCIIKGVQFTQDSFKKFIQLQTKLHDTVCEKRNAATIATHDLGLLAPNGIVYTAHPPGEIKIIPLGRTKEVTGQQLFIQLQREAEELRKEKKRNVYSGIHRYLYLLEGKPVYPCVMNNDLVISLPPITNCDGTKISEKTQSMFVEVTSASTQGTCRRVLDTFLHETLLLGIGTPVPEAEGIEMKTNFHTLTVQQVKIVDKEGNLKAVYPSRSDLVLEDDSVSIIRE